MFQFVCNININFQFKFFLKILVAYILKKKITSMKLHLSLQSLCLFLKPIVACQEIFVFMVFLKLILIQTRKFVRSLNTLQSEVINPRRGSDSYLFSHSFIRSVCVCICVCIHIYIHIHIHIYTHTYKSIHLRC